MTNWRQPDGHPISMERARDLMLGNLGKAHREMLRSYCAPIFWFDLDDAARKILHNGTVFFVQTQTEVIGVTARHVVADYRDDASRRRVRLQIFNAIVNDLQDRVIDESEPHDVATFRTDADLLKRIGKTMNVMKSWPPRPPDIGRGIMLAGYPGQERLVGKLQDVDFGLITIEGIATSVSDQQIIVRRERQYELKIDGMQDMPIGFELGGISGGPLISWIENSSGITLPFLSGIISQAHTELETIVCKRADFIRSDGSIDNV